MSDGQTTLLNKEERKRLKEMLSVLRKYEVGKGLTPEKLRHIFEDLGPTFVKVGQLLSMRPELIPQEYCDELSLLRTDVAPMSVEEARGIVETELGKSFSDVFSHIEATPIGSASIAQVHRGWLKDGTNVALKIQRSGIYHTMERDIRLLRRLDKPVSLSSLGKVINLNWILDELWTAARQEMNFRIEADNLEEFARNNSGINYISCPKVFREYSTEHLLVMEFTNGVQIDHTEELLIRGYDLKEIGKKLVTNYLKQILDDRFFQADPHPGNIYIEEGKICWLDLGMMCRLSEFDADCYASILNAVLDHDYMALKDTVLLMGVSKEKVDEERLADDFERFIRKYEKLSLTEINLGAILREALDLAAAHKIKLPSRVTMLSRGISTLEGLLEIIAPDVSVISVLATNHSQRVLKELDWKKESLSLLKDIAYSGRDILKLPAQVSSTIGNLQRGRLKIRIEHADQEKKAEALNSASKRLAAGLISAAMILAAAIVYASQTAGSLVIGIVLFALGILSALRAFLR